MAQQQYRAADTLRATVLDTNPDRAVEKTLCKRTSNHLQR